MDGWRFGTDNPRPEDIEAQELLRKNEMKRLEAVRSRSSKWLAGIPAATALISAAYLIAGQISTNEIGMAYKAPTAGILLVAVIMLVVATYYAFLSAYGSPTKTQEIKLAPLKGLADRLKGRYCNLASAAESHARTAISLAVAGVFFSIVAITIIFLAPNVSNGTNGSSNNNNTEGKCLFLHASWVDDFNRTEVIYEEDPAIYLKVLNRIDVEKGDINIRIGPCP